MATDARDYVAQLYQQELGRSGADDPGMQAWADAIASGAMSREAVQQAIAGSQEGVRYDVGSAYQKELGRSGAEDPGMQAWVNAVTSGGMTTQQAIDQIARSQEAARYDIGREYTGTLKREGTYEELRAKDPAIAQWEQALMSGAITEQQFRDAVRQSAEYKGLTTPPPPKTPVTPPPLQQTPAPSLMPSLNQYAGQLGQLQQQAITSAGKGYFEPTYSAPQISQIPVTPAATTAAAPAATTAAPVAAQPITPAPAVQVPMTYLSPAPPQYRNIDPFQSPFTTPFRSYFDIANANRRMQYSYPSPYLGQPGQSYNPFPYYQGMYAQPAPQPQQGLPAGPTATPTTTPTV